MVKVGPTSSSYQEGLLTDLQWTLNYPDPFVQGSVIRLLDNQISEINARLPNSYPKLSKLASLAILNSKLTLLLQALSAT